MILVVTMNPQASQNEFSGRLFRDQRNSSVALQTIVAAQHLESADRERVDALPGLGDSMAMDVNATSCDSTIGAPVEPLNLSNPAAPSESLPSMRFRPGWTAGLSATLVLAGLFGADPAQAAIGLGDRGSAVQTMQTTLVQLGFDPGGVDGVFGPKTLKALIRFQQSRNLQADGILGPQTAQALAIVAPMGSGPELSSSRVGGAATIATQSQKGINIRQSPNGPVIGYAMDGVQVSLTGRESSASGRNWLELSTGGWVAADFVRSGQAIAPVAAAPADRISFAGKAKSTKGGAVQAYVRASRLNIRKGPAGEIIGYAKSGTAVSLTGNYKTADGYEWAEIASGGWVATQFLK
jgi:hypothetical protein